MDIGSIISVLLGVAAVLTLLIGYLVYLRSPSEQVNKYFLLFCISGGVWILSNLFFIVSIEQGTDYAFALLAYAGGGALATAFLAFVAHFVGRSTNNILYYVLIGLSLAVVSGMPGIVATGISVDGGIETTTLLPVYAAFLIFYFTRGLLILGIGLKVAEGSKRNQITVMFLGLLAGIIFGVWFNLLLPLLGNYQFVGIGPVATLFFIAASAYAITRHQLFDLRAVAARSVAYILLLVTLASIYGLVIFTISNTVFESSELSISQQLTYIAFALILAFSLQPLRRFFDRVTNALFFRKDYDPEQVLREVGDITANEVDLRRVSDKTLNTLISSLKLDFASMYIISSAREFQPYNFHAGNVPHKSSLRDQQELMFSIAANNKSDIIAADYLEPSMVRLQAAMRKAGVDVMLRLETSRELIGYVLFGVKQNGTNYTQKDLRVLGTVGDELALAIQNSLRFEEIQSFNLTLQEKVDSATTELRSTNTKLKHLDEAKDEFIGMASHQLRTPLTSIKGYLSMVLDGDSGKLQPEQEKLLKEAYASSERMVHLISDFLNLSRLKTGKFVLEPAKVNMASLVAEEVSQLSATAKARGVQIKYDKPAHFPVVVLDEGKLRQVVMNFIDNAIFYTRKGDKVSIELMSVKSDIVLRVKDTGIGVPASEVRHLFTKFFRATNARKARPDGTGIGLFMAKKVIMAHGGSIIFETKEGKGSTFGFKLPLAGIDPTPPNE